MKRLSVIHLICILVAIYFAVKSNPDQKLLRGIEAALIPQVYLLQYAVRSYRPNLTLDDLFGNVE